MNNGLLQRLAVFFLPIVLAWPVTAAEGPDVLDAWARATPPGATVGAVYVTLEGGAVADRLTGATSDRASSVELHTVEEVDGIARMRPLKSLEIPAGTRVELAPGGRHLMLLGLESPLVAGDTLTVVLDFEVSGAKSVEVPIRPAAATDESSHHQHH
jgi:hypothetical protein